MKKYIISSIVLLSSVFSYAGQVELSEVFKGRSLEVLFAAQGNLKLHGDGSSKDSVADVLMPMKSYLAGKMTRDNDLVKESRVKNILLACVADNSKTATCDLIIQFNVLGEDALTYKVALDDQGMPYAMANSNVLRSIGD
ncbi:MAG: hypothetical protein WA160_06730 [Pseudobdellovibrio sp.]